MCHPCSVEAEIDHQANLFHPSCFTPLDFGIDDPALDRVEPSARETEAFEYLIAHSETKLFTELTLTEGLALPPPADDTIAQHEISTDLQAPTSDATEVGSYVAALTADNGAVELIPLPRSLDNLRKQRRIGNRVVERECRGR